MDEPDIELLIKRLVDARADPDWVQEAMEAELDRRAQDRRTFRFRHSVPEGLERYRRAQIINLAERRSYAQERGLRRKASDLTAGDGLL